MLQPFMYSQKWQLQGQFSCPSAVGAGIKVRIGKGHPYFSFDMSCLDEFGMTSLFCGSSLPTFSKKSPFIKFMGTLTVQSDHRVGLEKKNGMDRQTDQQTHKLCEIILKICQKR